MTLQNTEITRKVKMGSQHPSPNVKNSRRRYVVNGEKLTVKKWWIFGADFFTVYTDFSRFVRDINGEKKTSRYR